MNLKDKFLRIAVCTALILALIPGCSSDGEGNNSTTAPVTAGSSATVTDPQVDGSEIKATYKLSEEDAAKYADENSPKPITYGGFNGKVFSTPALSSDAALATITPLYSHSGVHQYLHDNQMMFDLGEGDGSFAAAAESYSDEFFTDKALLIISFLDREGGADYSVSGAWEDHVSGEGFEMDRFVLGVKKSDGTMTAGHIILEIDRDFLVIWDTFGIEFYK